MASIVASSSSSHVSPVITVQEKGSRNKRKFRADTSPATDSQTIVSPSQHECLSYEFSAEKFECNGDICNYTHENTESVKLDLGLSSVTGGLGSANQHKVELEANDEFHDADWSDLSESQLEELVLANLDTMLKTAIKKIVAYGYTEEVATQAVLKSGIYCGCNDIVSSIVENTLNFLKNGHEIVSFREHHFESLQQMEKYILTELVCVLREVRPFFSTGDAMWSLLISDMNVSQACALDGDADVDSNGCSSNSVETHVKTEGKNLENFPLQAPVMASIPCVHNCVPESSSKHEISQLKQKSSFVLDGFASQKGTQTNSSRTMSRSFSLPSQKHEEIKPAISRKINGINKRDSILRQKSVHLEKSYRTHGLKPTSRAGKSGNIGGLILDKKLKSVSEFTNNSLKNPDINNNSPALPVSETQLSLSLPVKNPQITKVPNVSFSAMPCNNKSVTRWTPQDKKDQTIAKLVPQVNELQNQLQEWTEWANQKVMQAARRLGKDKAELKTLKQEKEEVERLIKEKKTLKENTMKKLSEMENALMKASNQVGRANGAVCRLEVENANLRLEMEAAKLQAAESAASCDEVAKREKKTLRQLQLWEKQKLLFHEELIVEKRKLSQLKEDLVHAKEQRDKLEIKWKQEEKAKQEIIHEAMKIRIKRQESEVESKSREDFTRLKADKSLQKYKEDIQKLEKEISQLRLESDSSKIAALKSNLTESNLTDIKTETRYITERVSVKRERECVMCLSEEMSVVFLPCAHQVVCTKCNELHEKQGMKDCPSCRGPIQQRITVRYAHIK